VTLIQVGRVGSSPSVDLWGGSVKRRRQLLGLIWCRWVRLYVWLTSGGGGLAAAVEDDDDDDDDRWFWLVRLKVVPLTPTPTVDVAAEEEEEDVIIGEEVGDAFDPIAVTNFDDNILATVIPMVALRRIPIPGDILRPNDDENNFW